MFISHMIGPVAETTRQDQRREHAAERQIAQARADGVCRGSAMAALLASVYLPPLFPAPQTHRQRQAHPGLGAAAAGMSRAPAARPWLSRVVIWLCGRRARIAAP